MEFLLAPDGAFYFLEMNTRLQVEHPVTEAVTGLDLVRLQLEVAAGRPLPFAQDDVVARGHALECRLYAEDPAQGDLPSPGTHPAPERAPPGPACGSTPGVETGSEVTVHYDPLLAKLVTWGAGRAESIERMAAALARTAVLGVATNQRRLRAIVDHPAFRRARCTRGSSTSTCAGSSADVCPPAEAVAAAVAALHRRSAASATARGRRRPIPGPRSAPGGSERA